ncbi:hypothetical protein EDC19_0467 [Natranaerovirga hydrolytica]|uniref:Uncharacterized protein n=1 Tax=Natranaerovirga hydrolytica TaxID=680378 RepID=A0A4R1MZP6_9FIRM|nr:hypothetical protein [Natranaerovirga hydrolytica]TCK98052.1 hypothetical protein EDC19_0467 [Natranaerovirga hydrolytica]
MKSIIEVKEEYNNSIDKEAEKIAELYLKDNMITYNVLSFIHQLYSSAKLNQYDNEQFASAYHNPITSDVEFYISRIIFHIIKKKELNWKISLRKQKNKCAPDIRIDYNNETKFIIEIKVKAGWIQQIFSRKRYEHDMKRYEENLIDVSPDKRVTEVRNQFDKYQKAFNIGSSKIFVLVSTLSDVHRKKYDYLNVNDYKHSFIRHTDLPFNNLVVLSNNLNIDISKEENISIYEPSSDLEKMLDTIFGSSTRS